jgi:hypothetical protein
MKALRVGVILWSLMWITIWCGPSVAVAAVSDTRPGGVSPSDREADLSKVLTVFEDKVEDPQVQPKVEAKLVTLKDEQIHLLASLAEKADRSDHAAGADVAFLLITVLIVLY